MSDQLFTFKDITELAIQNAAGWVRSGDEFSGAEFVPSVRILDADVKADIVSWWLAPHILIYFW